jgi:hypothetical protein
MKVKPMIAMGLCILRSVSIREGFTTLLHVMGDKLGGILSRSRDIARDVFQNVSNRLPL